MYILNETRGKPLVNDVLEGAAASRCEDEEEPVCTGFLEEAATFCGGLGSLAGTFGLKKKNNKTKEFTKKTNLALKGKKDIWVRDRLTSQQAVLKLREKESAQQYY